MPCLHGSVHQCTGKQWKDGEVNSLVLLLLLLVDNILHRSPQGIGVHACVCICGLVGFIAC